MYNVIIKGFESEALAREFINYYFEQGEQDFGDWIDWKPEFTDVSVSANSSLSDVQDEYGNWVITIAQE